MGLVMTLDSKSVRFDFDKAYVKPEYRDMLNRIAGILMTLKGYTIAVYGYTDDIGTQTYNLQLSQRRAEAVRDFLVQAGISPTIMTTKGFGKSNPRVPSDSEQARAANRRVEIGIVDSRLLTLISWSTGTMQWSMFRPGVVVLRNERRCTKNRWYTRAKLRDGTKCARFAPQSTQANGT
jgi:hypothetical protein